MHISLCDKHYISTWHALAIHLTYMIDYYFPVFPAEDIDCNVVKLLNLRYFMQRCWK